ncbi:hypothetical protein GALMADRAFT_103931 [Galerina marginata CBS 339.88]|uniref:CHAT domain-containing protein n=1 Tax=Galerina marginata (strain CBS 339.88) TaxID=685588 RepID=A0A067SIJ9_GALM3|nr:hypothetical protein GALMADRAFT_103931 [Galerina marginata CBS 339.88]
MFPRWAKQWQKAKAGARSLLGKNREDSICIMTYVVVERVSNAADDPGSAITQMRVEFFSDWQNEGGDTLLLNKVSSREWKYDRILQFKGEEVAFEAVLDDKLCIGRVVLGKTDIERLKSITNPTEETRDLLIAGEYTPRFRLRFQIVSFPLVGNFSKEIFFNIAAKDRLDGRLFFIIQSLPDNTANKVLFDDAYTDWVFKDYRRTQGRDIDFTQLHVGLSRMLAHFQSIPQPAPPSLNADPLEHAAAVLRFPHYFPGIDPDDFLRRLGRTSQAAQFTHESHVHTDASCPQCDIKALLSQFSRTRDPKFIIQSISTLQDLIQHTPENDPSLPIYLSLLGVSLRHRFSFSGDVGDISDAISLHRRAIQLTPDGHLDKATFFTNLGVALRAQFSATGDLADISEAISLQQKAIQLFREGDPSMPMLFSNLAISLHQRFMSSNEHRDIVESISLLKKAIQLTPSGQPQLPVYLTTLGYAIQILLVSIGKPSNNSEAISFLRQAVQLTPENHPFMPIRLSNLAASLQLRFRDTQALSDITESILSLQQAIPLLSKSHTALPTLLNDMGESFIARFLSSGELPDKSKGISFLEDAVRAVSNHHPNFPQLVFSLALSYSTCFGRTHDMNDMHMAISNFSLAANSPAGPPDSRLKAARLWVQFTSKYDPTQLLEAHGAVIRLISHVAGLEQTITRRHNNLIDISTASASASAVAFASERSDLALEWLEQGRCLVWRQLHDLRTPLDALQSYDSVLANKIVTVAQALEGAGNRRESSTLISETSVFLKSTVKDEELVHVQLARQWDQLLAEVRSIPDFEDFLKPPPSSILLRNLPNFGVVVVINVHGNRCDALALRPGMEPLHINLPQFSYGKAASLRNKMKACLGISDRRMRESKPEGTRGMRHEGSSLKSILSTLWTSVVKPILNGLGHFEPPSDLMRIWWCATGPLAFLPIHAAGIYNDLKPGTGTTLFDFAISSYTPTIRALGDIVKRPRDVENLKVKPGLFMIGQPDTPQLPPISKTTVEVRIVEQKLKARDIEVLCLDSAAATVDRGVQNMKAYSCVHFACHAMQDTEKPLASGFALYDGRLELSTIIQENMVDADFAFLSACQTSTGDEKLSEEAVHLAAGMLAAGYRGAVATMWSIEDKYGPLIAEDFYSNLTRDSESLSGEHAARALHCATRNLRKSIGDSESALLAWVPYVHFGL